ncbi:type II toxin-antitoxin system RelE/ParE family toxin [Desulfonatronospira sp.]|uniref:type II toxin-antitoxin system RelE family toxin n=1 Tax=Desulfonatronospira sp. TaxID=1962951 RepID=UPI0025BBC892|nr:type II toxin-antitoxin system RelE/ParE family toxin [Desulfonatronospira sp.]
MKVLYTKGFSKDLDGIIHNASLKKRLVDILEKLQQIDSPQDMKSIRKIQGYSEYYRIRIGDYRLGIKITRNCIEVLRFLHRKDIYKNFP